MSESVLSSAPLSQRPEYVVYSFLKKSHLRTERGSEPWQNMGATTDIIQARTKALNLIRSNRYSRVELRKKFISEKTGAAMDVSVEIFGETQSREVRRIKFLLASALGCALLALTLSLFV